MKEPLYRSIGEMPVIPEAALPLSGIKSNCLMFDV